jgi:membrane-associated phospholipid phosphatase
MGDRSVSIAAPSAAMLSLLLFVLCGLIGGASFVPDVAVIRHFVTWRSMHLSELPWLIAFTQLGSAAVLLPVTLIGVVIAGLLDRRRVWPLALTIIGGRLTIELIKVIVARPRPSLDAHPVAVFSKSFPSAHAGDSMLTLLALALWLSPPKWRALAVAAAVATSLAIGSSRPMLGVHWPSDVVGGWSFGLGWTSLLWAISRAYGRGGAAKSDGDRHGGMPIRP